MEKGTDGSGQGFSEGLYTQKPEPDKWLKSNRSNEVKSENIFNDCEAVSLIHS